RSRRQARVAAWLPPLPRHYSLSICLCRTEASHIHHHRGQHDSAARPGEVWRYPVCGATVRPTEPTLETGLVLITVLAGGIGAARFIRGLVAALAEDPDTSVSVVGNTGDDLTLYGLRVCPDLDTVMYTLGGGNDEARGWGRADETWHALEELRAYVTDQPLGAEVPGWFGLGDRDIGTHLVRTALR